MKYKAVCPPEWLSRSAVYQINPRTFSADGTIRAVTNELPKLKELGFRVSIFVLFLKKTTLRIGIFGVPSEKSKQITPKTVPYEQLF